MRQFGTKICIKLRSAAGLCPDPLVIPDHLAAVKRDGTGSRVVKYLKYSILNTHFKYLASILYFVFKHKKICI